MKIARILIIALLALMFIGLGSANAQMSVGYQGMIGSGSNMLNGISFRGWSDDIGYEGTFFYGDMDSDDLGNLDASIWIFDIQAMYTVIKNENSKFYVGLNGIYGGWDIEAGSAYDDDDYFWGGGPLIGAQFSFQGIPEVLFNWEVGYDFIDTDDLDLTISGINTTMGIHYAF